jgi:hypothetical protein
MMRDYCISAANAAVNDWQKKKKKKKRKKHRPAAARTGVDVHFDTRKSKKVVMMYLPLNVAL